SGDAGDPFENFVRNRSEYLFQLALLLAGRNQADAQDLLQVAVERAWRRRRAIARNDNPEAYVRRALVNASIDRWRWLRRRDERSVDAAGPGPADGRRWHRCVMANDPAIPVPNPVQRRDVEVLIGILAVLDGVIWGGSLDEWMTSRVAERLVRQGLLAADHNRQDVHQVLNDLNQRLRYAVGENDS